MDGDRNYTSVRDKIRSLTEGVTDTVALMAIVANEVHRSFEPFDWVSFYRVTESDMLRIGPVQGTDARLAVEIPFGSGICGRAARKGWPQIVTNAHSLPGYSGRDPESQAAIALPVRDSLGELIAVLNIDSMTLDRFTESDCDELEEMLAEVFGAPPEKTNGVGATPADRTRVFGPILLAVHMGIAAFGWGAAYRWGDEGAITVVEAIISAIVAVAMLVPVFLVVWAFFLERVRAFPTIAYMLGHAALVVVGYAAIFSMLDYGGDDCTAMWGRDLYFSAVTFTTLGYGDCAPAGLTRAFAAFEALLSYVFVGIVVGLFANMARRHRSG